MCIYKVGMSNFHFIPPLTSCQVAKLWQSCENWCGARLTLNNNMPFEEEEKKFARGVSIQGLET